MELDRYTISSVEDQPSTREYHLPPNATYYHWSDPSGEIVNVIPINNLLLTDLTQIFLDRLQRHTSSRSAPLLEREHLRTSERVHSNRWLDQIQSGQSIPPITVRQSTLIATPSSNDPNAPSVVGLGSAMSLTTPSPADYLYQIIDGDSRVAASLYLKYDHIPVIVKV